MVEIRLHRRSGRVAQRALQYRHLEVRVLADTAGLDGERIRVRDGQANVENTVRF